MSDGAAGELADGATLRGANMDHSSLKTPNSKLITLLYHFCRLQLPRIELTAAAFDRHLQRCFALSRAKDGAVSWEGYLANLHAVDWFLCCACLEGNARAW